MALSSESNSLLSVESLLNMNPAKVAIVATEWNDKIVSEQINGASRILSQFPASIQSYTVPGAFEIPFACQKIANHKNAPDAIICFGAVIRGGTPHFEYVCDALISGISQLNITLEIPIIFGVLTLENEIQAWERLGGIHGHKGEEAAIAALKMIELNRSLK